MKRKAVGTRKARQKRNLPRAPVTMNKTAGPMRDNRQRLKEKAARLDRD